MSNSEMVSNYKLSEKFIGELNQLAERHGFLILKPLWCDGKPDITIEIPTPEDRYRLGR